MKKKKIEIPLYSGNVTIIQTNNYKKLEKKYKTVPLHGFEAFIFRNDKNNGYSRYVICFKKKVDSAVIAHECLHLVNYVFADALIRLDASNDEPQAYLLCWIVGQCHKFLTVDDSKL